MSAESTTQQGDQVIKSRREIENLKAEIKRYQRRGKRFRLQIKHIKRERAEHRAKAEEAERHLAALLVAHASPKFGTIEDLEVKCARYAVAYSTMRANDDPDAVDRLIAECKAAERAFDESKAELDRKIAEMKSKSLAMHRGRLARRALTLELRERRLNWNYLDMVMHTMDLSIVQVAQDETVTGATEAVAAFKAAWPALFEGLPEPGNLHHMNEV